VSLGNGLWAQQHPSLDNYLFTPVAISPAHAGMQGKDVVSLVDAQLVGVVPGAPRTGIAFGRFKTNFERAWHSTLPLSLTHLDP